MKIAIPVEETNGLESRICEHFGKAPYFAIITVKGEEVKIDFYENPALQGHRPGLLPEMLHSLGVEKLIAKGVGRRAEAFFNQLGIEVIKGVMAETVGEALEELLKGTLMGNPNYEPEDKHEGKCEHHEH